jgi:chorismate synthase
MSSIYGTALQISIFGQSHSPAVGVTVDGLPAGLPVDTEELKKFLARRAPGQNEWSTPRRETDAPEFLSGLVGGVTCGAPLTAIIRSENTRPQDYAKLSDLPRPGHADYTAQVKFGGFQDPTGGGHFSGRLTAPLCVAGGICLQALKREGIEVFAHVASIGEIEDIMPIIGSVADKPFPVIDDEKGEQMKALIHAAKADGDSVGGSVECVAFGVPAGLGEPMFGGMENRISQIIFGIPAVKALEFGDGLAASKARGSWNNDPFTVRDGRIATGTNHCGGILGGITDGMPLRFRVFLKPTPSISREQQTVRLSSMIPETLRVAGRHDPCIVPRAVPCVEAAAAVAILDALCEARKYRR